MTSILIVEDESIVAADLGSKLSHLGYAVAGTAARGDEAVRLARELRPDLILMDIRLSGPFDGIQTAEIIGRECDLPVIYLTAHSDGATLERAKLTDPFGYILKPFDERDLRTHIEMALRKHQAERKLREAHERAEWLARFPQENPEPVLRVSLDGGVLYRNPAAAERRGWECEVGQPMPAKLLPLIERAVAQRQGLQDDVEMGGRSYTVAVALFPEEGYANLYGRDITDRKAAERDLRKINRALNALGHSGQALMRVTEEAAFLKEACKIVVQDCGYAMVWIGFAEDDDAKSIRPAEYAGFEKGYLDTLKLTWADTERGRGPTGTAVRTGQVCRCLDMLTDPKFLPWRQEALKRGYASSIALPLMAGGKAVGALTIYSREPIGFVEEEVKLLTDLAADFAQGIMAFRTRAARERAEQAVRESEARYRTLFNTMTEGFARHEIICDSEGKPCDYRFLDINPAFERLTGLKREDVVGKTVREIMPETEPIWIERYGRVALTGEPLHFEHMHAGLGRCYEVAAYRTAPGRFAAIFNDVTELKAMQQREREDAIRLAWGQSAVDTINAMREGVVLMEMDGTITSVNPAVEHLTGLTGGAMVGRNLEALLPELLAGADIETAMRGLALLRRGEKPDLPPLLLTRPDGKAVHILPSVALMDAPEGRRVAVLTLKDVTELHETSQRLRELAERLAATEEEERWRISRYIHDTIVQNLSLSNIRLGAMEKTLTETKQHEEANRLRQVRALLDQANEECRMVMSDLTPPLLYELGLVPALRDLARQLKAKHGTRMIVEDDGQERPMSHPLRGLLFEVTRELLMNALKHAGKCDLRVTVSCRDSDLLIRVVDDGDGFDPATAELKPKRRGGFGLFSIRQRLEGLGGRLDIESAPGKGTTATLTVPMENSGQ